MVAWQAGAVSVLCGGTVAWSSTMRKGRFLIGATFIALAVSYLVYAGIRETSVYYLKIDEFAAHQAELTGQSLRVAGRVRHGSIQWNARTLDLAFALGGFGVAGTPEPEPLAVEFNGILPDMFAEGRDVIVEGTYEGGGRFVARTILTSCPSKYEPEAPAS
jgi:cytochrome c-type biogenesis protein CcmE